MSIEPAPPRLEPAHDPHAVASDTGAYLDYFLRPFSQWLELENVCEILVNKPGELWIEIQGEPHMRQILAPEINNRLMQRLATQIARYCHKGINSGAPLLAATLPDGARVQLVAPSATRGDWAMSIRRHQNTDLSLDDYDCSAITSPRAITQFEGTPIKQLRQAITERRTLLISGGTSSGKTTFLNALLKEIPSHERIITVEDTAEIAVTQPNTVSLVAIHNPQGDAQVGVDELLKASLRLRPDRIVVGEIRGTEAVTFLRAINTGHPGSMTTVHANSTRGALEQVAMMVMQAQLGLGWDETLRYIRSLVDGVVQLERHGGRRVISDILWLNREHLSTNGV